MGVVVAYAETVLTGAYLDGQSYDANEHGTEDPNNQPVSGDG